MHPILIAVASVAGLVAVAAVLGVRTRHLRGVVVPVEQPAPRVGFRVLRTEEELSDALRRAAGSERLAAHASQSRIDRYEALLRPLVLVRPTEGEDRPEHRLQA